MKIADDSAAIKARLDEIEAERRANISGMPIEAPAEIDWTKWTMFSVEAPD